MAAVKHDVLAESDYRLMMELGIRSVRDGLRWHLIDRGGHYDWSSFLPMLRAAERVGVQVIWDIFHYGWPDDIDVWTPAFVDRFASFAGAQPGLSRKRLTAFPSTRLSTRFPSWPGQVAMPRS